MEKAIYDQMVKWTEDEELALYLSFAKRYPSGMKVTKVWRIDRHTPNESKGDTVLLRAKHSVSKTK